MAVAIRSGGQDMLALREAAIASLWLVAGCAPAPPMHAEDLPKPRFNVSYLDHIEKGKVSIYEIQEEGRSRLYVQDHNLDGLPDSWKLYDALGILVVEMADENHDLLIDTWKERDADGTYSIYYDFDYDGRIDSFEKGVVIGEPIPKLLE